MMNADSTSQVSVNPSVEAVDDAVKRRIRMRAAKPSQAQIASPEAIMVASRTGGQGKTVLAMAFDALLRRRGTVPQVYAIDSTGKSPISKIGGCLPGVVELRTGADLSSVAMRGDRAVEHLDPLADALTSSATIIDVGSNIIDNILEWGQLTAIGDALGEHNIALVIPVRDSEIAVRDAVAVVESARAAQAAGGIPFSRIVIAVNTLEDGDDVLAHTSQGRLENLNVQLMTIRREPNLLRRLELRQRPFHWAYGLHGRDDYEEIKDALGADAFKAWITAFRYVNGFRGWLDNVDAESVRAGLMPAPVGTNGGAP